MRKIRTGANALEPKLRAYGEDYLFSPRFPFARQLWFSLDEKSETRSHILTDVARVAVPIRDINHNFLIFWEMRMSSWLP